MRKLEELAKRIDDLEEALATKPLVDIGSYFNELEKQKKETDRMESLALQHHKALQQEEKLVAELKAKEVLLREKIARLEDDNKTLKEEIETIKVDMRIFREKAIAFEKENKLMSSDVDSLWRKKVALEDENAKLESDNKALREENESLKTAMIAYMTKPTSQCFIAKETPSNVKKDLSEPKSKGSPKFDELDHSAYASEYAFNHLPADKPQIFKQDVKYIEFLKVNGFSSTETIKKHFGVSQQAVGAHLRRLIASGIVVRSHEHPSDARQTYGINPDAPEYSVKRRKEAERKTPSISKLDESYLNFIKESRKPVTTKEVCEHFGAGKSTSLYHLGKLRNKGLIATIGPGGSRTYAAIDGAKYSIKRAKAPRRRRSEKNGKTSVQKENGAQKR